MEAYRRNCMSLLQHTVRNRGERLREANRETNLVVYATLPCLVQITQSVADLVKQNRNKYIEDEFYGESCHTKNLYILIFLCYSSIMINKIIHCI